ncbi:MAG: hypothetical protein PHG48_00980 [Eubacteriales bacterium]|nr:hypothetical protein [Eubacteriales bacterium]
MENILNPTSIILHMINAAILFVAVYFLLYKPVRKFMTGRSERIAAQLNEAQEIKNESEKALSESRIKTLDADRNAVDTIEKSAVQAQKNAGAIISDAENKAEQIISRAHDEAGRIMKETRESMEAEAAGLAVAIAAKILEREVNAEDNRNIIEKFLSEVRHKGETRKDND